eukprot:9777411-Lingulodinium_polyedra.AAC.1
MAREGRSVQAKRALAPATERPRGFQHRIDQSLDRTRWASGVISKARPIKRSRARLPSLVPGCTPLQSMKAAL